MNIAELRALLAAATPGPWGIFENDASDRVVQEWMAEVTIDALGEDGGPEAVVAKVTDLQTADAELIVAAVNALPALLAVAEAAQHVQDEWDRLGPTGTHSTLASHRALRAALAAVASSE